MKTAPSVYIRNFLTGPSPDLEVIARELSDVQLEARIDTFADDSFEYEDAGDMSSAEYARFWHAILTAEQRRRIALRHRHADNPNSPVWTASKQREYDRLTGLVDFLRNQWPIEKFMADLMAVELKPAGANRMKGRCPFHRDTNPSMTVYTDQGRYYCFACQAWGDVFDCVGRHFGVDDFTKQVEHLAEATPNVPDRFKQAPASRTKTRGKRSHGVRLVGGKVVAA